MKQAEPQPKPAVFMGSSQRDLRGMPARVRRRIGQALFEAQLGRKSDSAKPMKGFRGAGVLEVVEDFDTDTYRAVYTVRFAGVLYILHCFQKKSTHGIATSAQDVEVVAQRLREAEDHYYRSWLA